MTYKAAAGSGKYRPVKRNYDGNSDACVDCKSFYDGVAPCETCEYRLRELAKMGDQK